MVAGQRPDDSDAGLWHELLGPAAELIAEGVVIHDASCRVRAANGTARKLLGLPDHRRGVGAWSAIGHPPAPDGMTAAARSPVFEVLADGMARVGTCVRLRAADGRETHLSANLNALRRDGEAPFAVVTTFTGETCDACDEPALEPPQEAYEAETAGGYGSSARINFDHIFDAVPVGVIVADFDQNSVSVNEACSRILGWPREQLEGSAARLTEAPFDTLIPESQLCRLREGASQMGPCERDHERPDRRKRVLEVDASVILSSTGRASVVVLQVQDVTERKHLEAKLRHQADHDPLTGAMNRRSFSVVLGRHLAEVARYGPRGAVALLDIDHFKTVNDSHGHLAGDELLRRVSDVVRQRLRATDYLARIGGDEFAVLLPHADADEATAVLGDLLRLVRERIRSESRRGIKVTASAGVCPIRTADVTQEEILACADEALYSAKRAGRDGIALACVSRKQVQLACSVPPRARSKAPVGPHSGS